MDPTNAYSSDTFGYCGGFSYGNVPVQKQAKRVNLFACSQHFSKNKKLRS